MLLNVWQQVGYFTVLAVAGLTQIPGSLYEAAQLDGANAGAAVPRHHAAAAAATRCCSSAVIAIINAVQVFEPVALITQGGPVGSTNVLTYHIRRVGIERAQGGLGSAMAVTLMLSLIVVDLRAVRLAPNRQGRRMSAPTLPRQLGVARRAGVRSARKLLLASLMLLVAVAAAFPLVWMVLSSLKTAAETMQVPPVWIPRTPNLEAYEKVSGVVECRPLDVELAGHRLDHHGRHPADQPDGRLRLRQIPLPRPRRCCSPC